MAKVAATLISGGKAEFKGADMSTKLKLLGVDVASLGDAQASTVGSQSFVYQDDVNQIYKRLIVSKTGKKLLGAVLIGEADAYGSLLQLMLNGIKLPNNPSRLYCLPVMAVAPALGLNPCLPVPKSVLVLMSQKELSVNQLKPVVPTWGR